MINKNSPVPEIAKDGTAERPDLWRGLEPAGGFGVENSKLLEGPILLFGEEADAHNSRKIYR